MSSTLLTTIPRAHFQNDKLTRNHVSKTRGYIAGTKYVRRGRNISCNRNLNKIILSTSNDPPIYYSPFQSLLFQSERIQIFHHPIQVPSLTVHGAQCYFRAIVEKSIIYYASITLPPPLLRALTGMIPRHTRLSPAPVASTATTLSLSAQVSPRDLIRTSRDCNYCWGFTSLDPAF